MSSRAQDEVAEVHSASGLQSLLRRARAGLGVTLVAIGVPVAILTPIPLVPIGLPIIIAGAVLLARNSHTGRRAITHLFLRFPGLTRVAPDRLKRMFPGGLSGSEPPHD